MDEKYMNIALKEAKKSYKNGDVPVGAVVLCENKVVSKSYNMKEAKNNATRHAEIIAIEKACKVKGNWRLDDCTLYVTMEPCLMCAGAIIQSRIKRVVYGAKNDKFGFVGSIDNVLKTEKNNHITLVESGVCEHESKELLRMFFKDKRN